MAVILRTSSSSLIRIRVMNRHSLHPVDEHERTVGLHYTY